jgi:hypothetical protein
MRSSATQRTGQIGVNVVERICLEELRGRWQAVDGHNDDGTDGLLFLEDRSGELTGQIVFIQVKCWALTPTKAGYARIAVDKNQIQQRSLRWRRVAGAAIIVWVNPATKEAFWADLDRAETYDSGGVRVPIRQKFCGASLERLKRLAGTIGADSTLPLIETVKADLDYVRPERDLRSAAKDRYRAIGSVGAASELLGMVQFKRVGWQHITRNGRPILRIIQSLQLLGVAQRIVAESTSARLVRRLDRPDAPAELYAVDARVTFPHRDPAVVRVIVLKQLTGARTSEERSWFYSVYERRRRRGLKGEHSK